MSTPTLDTYAAEKRLISGRHIFSRSLEAPFCGTDEVHAGHLMIDRVVRLGKYPSGKLKRFCRNMIGNTKISKYSFDTRLTLG